MNPNECTISESNGAFALIGATGATVAELSRALAPNREAADHVLTKMRTAFGWGEEARHRDDPQVDIVANRFDGKVDDGKRYWIVTESQDAKVMYDLMPRGLFQRRPPAEVKEFVSLMTASESAGRKSMEAKLETGQVDAYDHSQGPEVYGRLIIRP